jgi:hypothetical protein
MDLVKLHDCPYTNEIVCDAGYSVKEANRQILAKNEMYVKDLYRVTTECRCDPNKCKRYLDKMKQLNLQKQK